MTTGVVQVQTTLPDEPSARALAKALVDERLAACVQVLGPVASTYQWNHRTEQATEWLCLIKTGEATVEATLSRIRERHPYQVPELLVVPVIGGGADYLAWVRETLGGAAEDSNRS